MGFAESEERNKSGGSINRTFGNFGGVSEFSTNLVESSTMGPAKSDFRLSQAA
jgi:hypothetical protein